MGNITICSVVKVLIVLLLLVALVVYGAVANYRLKQLSCATNSGAGGGLTTACCGAAGCGG